MSINKKKWQNVRTKIKKKGKDQNIEISLQFKGLSSLWLFQAKSAECRFSEDNCWTGDNCEDNCWRKSLKNFKRNFQKLDNAAKQCGF
jgi:hypothetical protein